MSEQEIIIRQIAFHSNEVNRLSQELVNLSIRRHEKHNEEYVRKVAEIISKRKKRLQKTK